MKVYPYFPNSKEINTHEMSEWSVLNTKMHYVQHPRQAENSLLYSKCEDKIEQGILDKVAKPELVDMSVGENSVKEVFCDQFEEVQNFLHLSDAFNDARDVSTTYLGTDQVMLKDHFQPECSFPIYSNSHTWGQLMGGQPFDMILDSGASKCYMSTEFYKKNPQLHKLPKYKTMVKELRMGNGALSPAYFIIPVVFGIVRHKLEMYALVADIKGSADLVFGMKNMFEAEGEHSCRNSEFRFMNRVVPLFCLENVTIKPKQKKYVKLIAPFVNYLSGNAIAKINHGNSMLTMRIKLQNNVAVVDIINTSNRVLHFCREKAMGIVDIRSLGYYTIRHGVLEYNLSSDFTFANFNKLASAYEDMKIAKAKWRMKDKAKGKNIDPKKVKVDLEDPYPWLPKDDPRRNMSDEEILRKFVDLSKSDMTDEEMEELMELILDHRDAFSLRDEIGECPNITIDIDVIDDSPFFVRPFPISQEDKPIMDWQMQRLVSLGILSKNTTSHTSPVMLITRKIGADKRPVVDFRLLNTRVKRYLSDAG